MKATGIVRKIDNLGRIVVPRELLKTMEISRGDLLEIFTEDNCVVLKRYKTEIHIADTVSGLKLVIEKENDLKNQSCLLQKIKEIEELISDQT